jgi:hypothetical protein
MHMPGVGVHLATVPIAMISQEAPAIHDHMRRLAELREEMDNMRRAYGFGEPNAALAREPRRGSVAGFSTLGDGQPAGRDSRV